MLEVEMPEEAAGLVAVAAGLDHAGAEERQLVALRQVGVVPVQRLELVLGVAIADGQEAADVPDLGLGCDVALGALHRAGVGLAGERVRAVGHAVAGLLERQPVGEVGEGALDDPERQHGLLGAAVGGEIAGSRERVACVAVVDLLGEDGTARSAQRAHRGRGLGALPRRREHLVRRVGFAIRAEGRGIVGGDPVGDEGGRGEDHR